MANISMSSSSSAWKGRIEYSYSQSVAGNYTTVTASVWAYKTDGYSTGGNTNGYSGTLRIGSSSKSFNYRNEYDDSGNKVGVCHAELTATIYHDDSTGAGSTTISCTITGPSGTSLSGKSLSGSQNVSFPTIARKSILSVSGSWTFGGTLNLSADRKNSAFTHTLTWSCGGQSGNIDVNSNSTSWSFTPELTLASVIPNTTSVKMTFTLSTLSGGSTIGTSSIEDWLTLPDSIVPTVELGVSDTTTNYIQLGKYLQSQSALNTVITARGVYGSSINHVSFTFDGVTYTDNLGGSSYAERIFEQITNVIVGEGRLSLVVTVRDTRGRQTRLTQYIDVQSYNAPRITQLDVHRSDSDGSENQSGLFCKVTYSFSVSSSSTGTATLKYKKSEDSAWTEVVLPSGQSADGLTAVFPADDGSPYDIVLVISDSYGSAERTTKLSTGYTLIHYPASGQGMTIGAVATQNGFNVHMISRFNKGFTYKPLVKNTVDCDTMLESGVFFIGYQATHTPTNKVGWLDVMSINDGYYCIQTYTTYNYEVWVRYRQKDAWNGWVKVLSYA